MPEGYILPLGYRGYAHPSPVSIPLDIGGPTQWIAVGMVGNKDAIEGCLGHFDDVIRPVMATNPGLWRHTPGLAPCTGSGNGACHMRGVARFTGKPVPSLHASFQLDVGEAGMAVVEKGHYLVSPAQIKATASGGQKSINPG